MIDTRDWEYVHFPNRGIGELYDLANDSHELGHVFHERGYADKVNEMRLRLLNHLTNNQRPYIGERTRTVREYYTGDDLPPGESFPGV